VTRPTNLKLSSPPPRSADLVQAVLTLVDGLPCPDRYLVALVDLIEGEYVRRMRVRRRVA
jgi:hypothetical protein